MTPSIHQLADRAAHGRGYGAVKAQRPEER